MIGPNDSPNPGTPASDQYSEEKSFPQIMPATRDPLVCRLDD